MRSTSGHRSPSASPWRSPSVSAIARRAAFLRLPATVSSRRASSTVSGSISLSSSRGGLATIATFRATCLRLTASLRDARRVRWAWCTVPAARPDRIIRP